MNKTKQLAQNTNQKLKQLQQQKHTLSKANADYHQSIGQLTELNDDFNHLLQSTDAGILFLDEQLKVRRFTESIQRHIDIKQENIGNHIGNLSIHIDYPHLAQDAQSVLTNQQPLERKVCSHWKDWYWMRILPYRSAREQVKGVVIAFVKIAELSKMTNRLTQLAEALERQGLQLLKSNRQLKQQISTKEQITLELAQQKNLLESILDSMAEGIIVLDQNNELILLNDAARNITGLTPAKTTQQPLAQWVQQCTFYCPTTEQALPQNLYALQEILQNAQSKTCELLVRCHEQTQEKYIRINARSLKNLSGQIDGSIITISDITHQKKAEKNLQKSLITEQALSGAITDLMFKVNKQGTYIQYIPAKEGQSIIPPATFLENNLQDILPNEIAENALETLQKALETSSLQAFEFDLLLEDTRKFYKARFSPLNDNEAICIIQDITEKLVWQESVKKSAEYYKYLVESAPFPVALHNKKGKFILFNDATRELLGLAPQSDLSKKSIFDFIVPKERSKVKRLIKEGFQDQLPNMPAEFTLVTVDGALKRVAAKASIICYQTQLVVQVALQEITAYNKGSKKNRNPALVESKTIKTKKPECDDSI